MPELNWVQETLVEAQRIVDEGREATLQRQLRIFGRGTPAVDHRPGAECYTDGLIALAYRFLEEQHTCSPTPPHGCENYRMAWQRLTELKEAYIRKETVTDEDNRLFCASVSAVSPSRSLLAMLPVPLLGGVAIIALAIIGYIIYRMF